MINTETRAFYNSICDMIKSSPLPPVNIEMALTLILRDVSAMTNEAINREQAERNEEEENDG